MLPHCRFLQRYGCAHGRLIILWGHWLAVLVCGQYNAAGTQGHSSLVPEHDPYLLPLAALLTGWGTLTIWRLDFTFGLRQTAWLAVVIGIFTIGLRLPSSLAPLRHYKYIWLSAGLGLTALTLFLGTNPMGAGPRLWLGCCGVYFQPSEPLKLLMVVYLAAYLADRQPYMSLAGIRGNKSAPLLPLLAPTLVMIGLAILLLFAQRDLGTASIFLILYAVVVYVASGNARILALGACTAHRSWRGWLPDV
jgi:cell division protein FtsW (lipid II flippase)